MPRIFLLLAGLSFLSAQAQPDPAEVEIRSTDLASGIHMLLGAGGSMALSVGEDGAFLIDDQYAPLSDKIMSAIAEITDQPVRFVINTHWHQDHTGGNENFARQDAIIVAHENVRTRMSSEQFIEHFQRKVDSASDLARPVVTFSQGITLHLNGEAVRIIHVPEAHTDGDAIVQFLGANVIHIGDLMFAGSYPFIDLSSGGSIDGYIAALRQVEALADGSTRIIAGHGGLKSREDVSEYRAMLQDIRDRVAALKRAGSNLEAIIEAAPDEKYRAEHSGWIKPEHLIGFIYHSL